MNQALGRRDQKKAEVRQRLIDIGIQLLSEQTLESITVDDIISLASISKKTFYNYFSAKHELIEAISESLLFEQSEINYQRAIRQFESTQERLEFFIIEQGKNLSDRPTLERNLIKHAMLDLSIDTERTRQKLESNIELFQRLFDQGLKRGDVNEQYSSRFLAEMVAGAMNTSAIYWIHLPDYPLNKRFFELKRFIMEFAIKAPK